MDKRLVEVFIGTDIDYAICFFYKCFESGMQEFTTVCIYDV